MTGEETARRFGPYWAAYREIGATPRCEYAIAVFRSRVSTAAEPDEVWNVTRTKANVPWKRGSAATARGLGAGALWRAAASSGYGFRSSGRRGMWSRARTRSGTRLPNP